MIIADADNGLSAILNSDSPPTKMFVYGTKARDDEARKCVVLDFDGRIGRTSDPEFENGNITEVDSLIYDEQVTEEDIASEDGLFANSEKTESVGDLNDDDFSFVDEKTTKDDTGDGEIKDDTFLFEDGKGKKSAIKKEVVKKENQREAPAELVNDDIFVDD
jgi:hypothetical protein